MADIIITLKKTFLSDLLLFLRDVHVAPVAGGRTKRIVARQFDLRVVLKVFLRNGILTVSLTTEWISVQRDCS